MKKLSLILSMAVLSLTACTGEIETNKISEYKSQQSIGTICLDGVAYWESMRMLAVRVDPETRQPLLCNEVH